MVLYWFITIPALLVYVVGALFILNWVFEMIEKVARQATDKYKLWGIMREAGLIYFDKKRKKKKEAD